MQSLRELKRYLGLSKLWLRFLYVKWLFGLNFKNFNLDADKWIFSRTACLGNESFEELNRNSKTYRFNLQKVRSDLLLLKLNSKRTKHGFTASRFIDRDDIIPLIWSQFHLNLKSLPKPKYILFDSFSDLTDLKFLDLNTNSTFFCHKSDLRLSSDYDLNLQNLGLLSVNSIENIYRSLFQSLFDMWGEVEIFFIHFPTNLELRPLYLERARSIEQAINMLSSENSRLHSITIPEQVVKPQILPGGQSSSFPYHYSSETSKWAARKISEILASLKVDSE